jgi:hypothetical protein
LQEKLEVTTVAENAVRNYVNDLRDRYHIPKEMAELVYGTVEEFPKGKQMQEDFGEKFVYTTNREKELSFTWPGLSYLIHVVSNM